MTKSFVKRSAGSAGLWALAKKPEELSIELTRCPPADGYFAIAARLPERRFSTLGETITFLIAQTHLPMARIATFSSLPWSKRE
jgi:hypothetical protein